MPLPRPCRKGRPLAHARPAGGGTDLPGNMAGFRRGQQDIDRRPLRQLARAAHRAPAAEIVDAVGHLATADLRRPATAQAGRRRRAVIGHDGVS
ncbi:hypothetical protein SXCC_01556 [Gluconacetobacter sp. SXCC-1]|nr:hypothetical protein SXCC_01556 [Gluconacetobacter sp. SXCC-1]